MKPYIFLILATFSLTFAFSQSADDYFKEARSFSDQKEYGKALASINKALHLDASNIDYYDLKVNAQVELNKHEDAYFTLCKAISIFPKEGHLYDRRGTVLGAFAENDAAIADYNKAIELAVNDTFKYMSITNRASAKIFKRDFEGAYQDLMSAYRFDSTQLGVLVNLGAVCDESGRGDQTLTYLLKALALDSSFVGSWGNIGFKYQEMGDYKKAIQYFNKVLELEPGEALGYSNRAFCRLKLKDPKGALTDINKSIELYPGNSYAYRVRALIHIDRQNLKLACEDIQASLDRNFTERYGDEVLKLQKQYCDPEKDKKTL